VRRRLLAIGALLAALAAAILLAVLPRGAGAGPLAWPSTAGTSGIEGPARIGQTAAMTIVMPHKLSTSAVLLDVHPLHAEDAEGLTLRYAATTGRRGLELAGQRGWNRPAWQERPLRGFVIPAHVVGGVTIGASSTRRGVHVIRGFVVDYRVGATRYSATMHVSFGLCVGYSTCP